MWKAWTTRASRGLRRLSRRQGDCMTAHVVTIPKQCSYAHSFALSNSGIRQRVQGTASLGSEIQSEGFQSSLSIRRGLLADRTEFGLGYARSYSSLSSSGSYEEDFDDLGEPISSKEDQLKPELGIDNPQTVDIAALPETEACNMSEDLTSLAEADQQTSSDSETESEFSSEDELSSDGEIDNHLTSDGLPSDKTKQEQESQLPLQDIEIITPGALVDVDGSPPRLTYGLNFLESAFNNILSSDQEGCDSLWRVIEIAMKKRPFSCQSAIEKWIEDGNILSKDKVLYAIARFRMRAKYARALEISDWSMTEEAGLELDEFDYASRLDLISKVHGASKVKQFFELTPVEHRGELVHEAMLVGFAEHVCVQDAEALLKAYKGSISTSMYNQLLVAYRRSLKLQKLAETVAQMESSVDAKPDIFTYNILLEAKAREGKVKEMEILFDQLKEDGLEADLFTYSTMARAYLTAGSRDQAKAIITEMESSGSLTKRLIESILPELYAELGEGDRVASFYDGISTGGGSKVALGAYVSMVKALGKVGKVEKAKKAFEEMRREHPSLRPVMQYNALLSAYSDNGMAEEAEELLRTMQSVGVLPSAATFDFLIKMYIELGQADLALATLNKAQRLVKRGGQHKPYFSSYKMIIDVCAAKGSVAMAEKTLRSLKQAGYTATYAVYSSLLNAYSKAKLVPYGFIDRMKADGNIPNAKVRSMVKSLDGT